MEIVINNTINNTTILDSTYYMSEDRMDHLCDIYSGLDTGHQGEVQLTMNDGLMFIMSQWSITGDVRNEEACVCNTLTHEGECACEQKCADPSDYYPIHGQEYHGMLHDIAIKAFWKSTTTSSPRGDEVFSAAVDYLDRVEQVYTPGETRPLPYPTYKACKAFRTRLNLFRYELYVLTYEQWAYLTNWLNVLTSYVHMSGENKGELKQYPCNMDNTNNKELEVEDIEYEIISMWYTQD